MKVPAIATLALLALLRIHLTGSAASRRSPVLIELFTSEGCSSCPPADALLEKWDISQPVPGAELIVMSEHVDYWNHDGWKDPYSSSSLTDRQTAYARVLGIDDVYTPQMIVDGTAVLRLADPSQISQVIQKAAATPSIPVRIESVTADGDGSLRAHIEADGTSEKQKADVYVALALNRIESQVSAGENRGRHLSHVAVVEYLKKIGTLDAGKSLRQDVQLKLKTGANSTNIRIIAFVQEPGPGKVVGAALRRAQSQ